MNFKKNPIEKNYFFLENFSFRKSKFLFFFRFHFPPKISNTLPNVTKFVDSVSKNMDFAFFEHLRSSDGFLSAIFGIFENFWINMRKNIIEIFFFEIEKISKKATQNHLMTSGKPVNKLFIKKKRI